MNTEYEIANPTELAKTLETAFNTRDEARLLGMWAPGFTYVGPGNDRSVGPEAMLVRERNLWTAFPDIVATVRCVCSRGAVLVLETTFCGRHSGPLQLGADAIPGTGRALELTLSVQIVVEDGRLVSERTFYDRMDLLTQLGLL